MENNFDIHNWQAKYLKESIKPVIRENIEDTAYRAIKYVEAAYRVLEQYKEQNQIPSNESEFNDIEAMLEAVVDRLEELYRISLLSK